MKRYCLKLNGAVYDTVKKKEIPLEKVVELLNKEHEVLLEKSTTIKDLLVENSLLSENLEDTILENESLKIRLEKFKREFREHGILTEQEFLQLITY